jgi:FMN phosphatase YigB (HAD superfamily)
MFFDVVRSIVFDLNGTLVVERYLRPDDMLERVLKCQRRGRKLSSEDLKGVARGEWSLAKVIAKIYDVKNPEYTATQYYEKQASRVSFRLSAQEVLNELRKQYQLILCSDTTGIAKEVCKNLTLHEYFENIFFSCDVGHLKSEREFWIEMLSHFQELKTHEILVVGDNSRADTFHPNRLGMHTILIENPIKLDLDYREAATNAYEEKPEHRITELKELIPLLVSVV